jgi:membrane fusion protein, multidrug efflux system
MIATAAMRRLSEPRPGATRRPPFPHDREAVSREVAFRTWIKKRWIIACLIGLAVLLCLWLIISAFLRPKKKVGPPPPIPVGESQIEKGSIDVYLDELGTVTPVYTVTVASRVAGELTEVRYKEGQLVKRNELLAVVDPRPYQAILLQSQGQLSRDEAALKNARIDLVRYQNSFKEHAIPQQQLATQEALVEQDEGTVKLDQGNLAAAQVNVDYTSIVSPIDGRVGLRLVDPGNIVPANGTAGIATITQLQPITVIFTIAEDSLSQVVEQTSAGTTLAVKALDRTKQHQLADGTLLTVDNQINTTTGTVRARATFPNTHNELFPNQFVNVRLLVKTLTDVTLVPEAAIQRNNDAAYVYVIQPDSTVKQQNIKIVATEGEFSAATGVDAGQQVVSDGFDRLQSGSKVTIRKPGVKGATSNNGGGQQSAQPPSQ